ncbi:MAG: histidine kinase N-terminal domain-containing protein [Streptosporangiales bacterium]|nr:histidine kinase N-terminal domain-containing protein [Streptosporangiales bacterium]
MPTLSELVQRYARDVVADPGDVEWLHMLVSEWQLLADLSFADLLLWLPAENATAWVCAAQVRPATGPTAHLDDVVGQLVARGRMPLVDRAWDQGRICREGDPSWRDDDVPVREETIPVHRGQRLLGVVARHTNLTGVRTPSRLELTYLRTATELAQMIAAGRFPRPGAGHELGRSPRVGDGLIRLDLGGLVAYASPNALSAYRRLGLTADLVGQRLADVTYALAPSSEPVDEVLAQVVTGRAPANAEVEGNGVTVQIRAIPLEPTGARIGALVLVRDVTDLRHRERELLTKDATIREIHHRVKNNLQTVAALLRLQSRRLDAPAARAALDEAVRRVGSIAMVHETLSQSDDEEAVDFDEVVARLVAMVVDVSAADGEVVAKREGAFGTLPAELATPLSLVLTELLQNAVEHGLRGRSGEVGITADRTEGRLRVRVTDDGAGLPQGFDATRSVSLGLQIVRTLVMTELGGVLELGARPGGGTRASLDLPLPAARR